MTEDQATAVADGAQRREPRMQTVDFTRPTKFTADHERRLRRVLATFCRTSSTRLAAELRVPVELEVVGAEQLTWSHAHDKLPPAALCAIVELRPADTRMLLCADIGFMLTAIESLLGGPPDAPPPERRLTEIDLALAEHMFESMLGQLSVVWRDLAGVELALAGVDTAMETAQVAPVSEPTLALTLEARMLGAIQTLTLLVPHQAIAPIEDRILGRAGRGAAEVPPAVRSQLRGALAGVEVTLCAEIAGSDLTATEVLSLGPGDTLGLGVPTAAGLALCVEGAPVLRGIPGRSGVRRAIQVVETVEPAAGEPTAPRLGSGGGGAAAAGSASGPLNRSLGAVPVGVWAELGQVRMETAAVVDLPPGAVVELDRRVDDPICLYVNGMPFATGGLVVAEGSEWAVRIDALSGSAADFDAA
jgi:flagellar motor switch protein FliM